MSFPDNSSNKWNGPMTAPTALLKRLVSLTEQLNASGGTFLTEAEANALYFRLDGSNSPFTKTSATVVTVPDAFSLTSLGSIALTAGGTNQNITLTPSGTGGLVVASTGTSTMSGTLTSPVNDNFYYQTYLPIFTSAGSGTDFRTVNIEPTLTGGVAAGALRAGRFRVVNQSTSTLGTLQGFVGNIVHSGSSTVTSAGMMSANLALTSTGNVTNFTGYNVGATTVSSTGDVTGDSIGFGVANIGRASATNVYGVNVIDQTAAGTLTAAYRGQVSSGTGKYNAYMDGTASNLFGGAVILPSTNTAGLQLYNTADQTTNYERLVARWTSNIALLGTETGSSNTARAFRLFSQNTNNNAQYHQLILSGGDSFPQFIQGTFTTLAATTNNSLSGAGSYSVFGRFTSTATSGSVAVMAITPTYNQASGTAANTDLLINRTQTAVGSGAQLLADFQVGGVSRFSVTNGGAVTALGSIAAGASSDILWTGRTKLVCSANGVLALTNNAATDFSRLQFGGTTSSFPALKRSTTTLQVRLADDSADAPLSAAYYVGGVQALSGAGAVNVTQAHTDYTSTGGAEALTLADGTAGQTKTICHVTDGGSGVLTPTTKTGFTTITFTNAGDSVTLRFSATGGWYICGIFGAVAA